MTDFIALYSLITGYLCFALKERSQNLFWKYCRQKAREEKDSLNKDRLALGFISGVGITVIVATIIEIIRKNKK